MANQVMNLVVLPRGKPIKSLPGEIPLPRGAPVSEIYQRLAAESGLSVDRIRVTKGSDGQLVPNTKDTPILSTGLLDGSKIYVKDLGPQIAWQTVFLVEYLGPILIHPVIFFLRPVLYRSPTPVSYPPPSSLQIISLALVYLHFMKRELETLYIHRFSASTMPLRNIFKNSFHYWIISGVFMAYFMYSPTSRTAGPINPLITYPGLALFAIGELGNLNAHYVLRNLRKEGTKERGIPQGLGFNLVTCPNYMFEAMAWFGITLVSQNWAVLVFAIVSIGQMAIWSKKKERNYRKEFGDKYQKKRYGLLPGIY